MCLDLKCQRLQNPQIVERNFLIDLQMTCRCKINKKGPIKYNCVSQALLFYWPPCIRWDKVSRGNGGSTANQRLVTDSRTDERYLKGHFSLERKIRNNKSCRPKQFLKLVSNNTQWQLTSISQTWTPRILKMLFPVHGI